jgi:hypothetical protein
MGFRPQRSDSAPQTGEATAIATACTEKTSVTMSSSDAPVALPRCST